MHQIAKINHCETSILGGNGTGVKLAARRGCRYPECDSAWNRLAVLFQALVGGGDVFGQALGFGKRSAVGHAARQHRYNGRKASFWFMPKENIEMRA